MSLVRIYGDPMLRKKAAPVMAIDDSIRKIVEDMTIALYEEDGVGLAAPQIGYSLQIILVDPTAGEYERKPYIMINPTITYFSEQREDYEEGCLSIPDIRIMINRPSIISVQAQDIEGKMYVVEQASGLFARVVQHEVDHLEGILFVDRASTVRRQLIAGKLKRLAKSFSEKMV